MNAVRSRLKPDFTSINCRNCGIVPAREWCDVPPAIAESLNSRKCIRTVPKGTFLFHEGDEVETLYRLLSGLVLLRKGDDLGNSVVTRMLTPRATIGFRTFFDGRTHHVSGQCATEVVVCCIPAGIADMVFLHNRALERVFAGHVAHDLSHAEAQFMNAASLSVRERILLMIDDLARALETRREGGGLVVPLPVTRTDFAAMAGIARETLSRAIRALEAEGMAVFARDHLVLPDPVAFKAHIAAIRPPAS